MTYEDVEREDAEALAHAAELRELFREWLGLELPDEKEPWRVGEGHVVKANLRDIFGGEFG